ncbi:MAG: hypothetical protein DWQ02_07055 [Bacteroidetes bacterium]|nr:MAG: hypothetical protein DWQ02_07055 [Bacteroidota bacterium]
MAKNNQYAEINIEFIENHLPGLKSGEYKISARQELNGPGIVGTNQQSPFSATFPDYYVQVQGDRFNLKPNEVHTIFPPNNSLGEYSNVMPHIVFNRNTLPWERLVAPMSTDEATESALEKLPWMALLVFNEEELLNASGKAPSSTTERMEVEKGKAVSFADLSKGKAYGNIWPPKQEPGQSDEEKIRVIYASKATLKEVLPINDKELGHLTHARQARIGFKLNSSFTGKVTVEVTNSSGKKVHHEITSINSPMIGASLDTGPLPVDTYEIKITPDGEAATTQSINIKANDHIGSDVAIVISKRLPKPGVKSVVHLVSLEERYIAKDGGYVFNDSPFPDTVPLVSLKSWSFTAFSEKQTFRSILLHLNHEFLFGINISDAQRTSLEGVSTGSAVPDLLQAGFLQGRKALTSKAKVTDRAVKILRDKDHQYFIGTTGKIYNAAGSYLFDMQGGVPQNAKDATSKLQGYSIHPNSAQLNDPTGFHAWVTDGPKQYFLSEDILKGKASGRLAVFLIPDDSSPSLRLPDLANPTKATEITEANDYLKMGFTPLPHSFRRGGKSVSWYRGPLVTGQVNQTIPDDLFPVHCSDELLRYHTSNGMFDASYAAAWELGRLMALKSKKISLDLYNWKRLHTQQLKMMEQQELHTHLPFHKENNTQVEMPENVENWLGKLSLLKGIPFNYLVPDERMLPIESLRFFYLDPAWIASLMDGALSIGRVNVKQEKILHTQKLMDSATNTGKISGFLLRSAVVAGWPSLQVNAYDYEFSGTKVRPGDEDADDLKNESIPELNSKGNPAALELLRMERLSPNVLLCLFKGDAKVVDIHEKPEVIHFGFNRSDGTTNDPYYKLPHRSNGEESDSDSRINLDTTLFTPQTRIIKVEALYDKIKGDSKLGFDASEFTSAQFALAMVEGVERVRFIRKG